jgi:hypothetical protein
VGGITKVSTARGDSDVLKLSSFLSKYIGIGTVSSCNMQLLRFVRQQAWQKMEQDYCLIHSSAVYIVKQEIIFSLFFPMPDRLTGL